MRKAEISTKGLEILRDAAKRDASSTTLGPEETKDRQEAIREADARLAEAAQREEGYVVTAHVV